MILGMLLLASLVHAGPVNEQWIAILDDSVEDPETFASEAALKHGAQRGAAWSKAIKGFVFRGSRAKAKAMRRHAGVIRVEQDQMVQAYCHDGEQEIPEGIAEIGAVQNTTSAINGLRGSMNADIAVLDTGIYPHGDLLTKGGKHWNCASNRGCTRLRTPFDDNGHGTHVAGTAAARDDNRGVVGVAPDARLWSIKVLDRAGSGYWSWIINGLNLVAANASAIDVVNLSLGGFSADDPSNCGSSALHRAICAVTNRGVTVVVAAGNSGDDARNYVPGKYDQVITVSAIDVAAGSLASFSNFGPAVDLAAPGVGIVSTWPGDAASKWGYCGTASGTSMAAPHVSGAVALFVARYGRDCDHNGVVNAGDVACIREYLVAAGKCPDGSRSTRDPLTALCLSPWSWDRDALGEPALSVGEPF